jgi:hypothetical protein
VRERAEKLHQAENKRERADNTPSGNVREREQTFPQSENVRKSRHFTIQNK